MSPSLRIFSLAVISLAMSVVNGYSQNDVHSLSESFRPGAKYKVELKLEMEGELTQPASKTAVAKPIKVLGSSSLVYTERVLTPSEDGALRVIRQYKDVTFRRTMGDRDQQASLRASVRRLVVLRNESGAKVPFSPDGALTWGEIDAIRTDLFSPVLVFGLLPTNAVKPGESWPVGAQATRDLSEMERVEENTLKVTFVSMVKVKDQPMVRLSLTGRVQGVTEDGPSVQTLEGTMYFDPKAEMLTYLSLRGTQELQDANKKTIGTIRGKFTMNRTAATAEELNDDSLKDTVISPTPEKTLLLHDSPELGLRFVYPRSWRVGAVQGKQLTLEQTRKGGAILFTREPLEKLPTAEAFMQEAIAQVKTLKGTITATTGPKNDRFTIDAEIQTKKVRLEYAIIRDKDGGVTMAARFPLAETTELSKDFERIAKDVLILKAVK